MKAIFAGTFDPFTSGHRNITEQALCAFDSIIIAVAEDTGKPTAPMSDRIEIARSATHDLRDRVTVEGFKGLLTDYAKSKGIGVLVRGIRSAKDLDYERELTAVYRSLGGLQSLFFMPTEGFAHVSSSNVRTIAALGADLSGYVVPDTMESIVRVYGKKVR